MFLQIALSGAAQKAEHVFLIKLHAGLIEGVYTQNIGRNSTGKFQKIKKFSDGTFTDFGAFHGEDGDAAVCMGFHSTEIGLLLHKAEGFAFQVAQMIRIPDIANDGHFLFGGIEPDHGLEDVPLALLDQLSKGMEVGGELHRNRENALPLLALGFAEKLLPLISEAAETGLEGDEKLCRFSVAVQ